MSGRKPGEIKRHHSQRRTPAWSVRRMPPAAPTSTNRTASAAGRSFPNFSLPLKRRSHQLKKRFRPPAGGLHSQSHDRSSSGLYKPVFADIFRYLFRRIGIWENTAGRMFMPFRRRAGLPQRFQQAVDQPVRPAGQRFELLPLRRVDVNPRRHHGVAGKRVCKALGKRRGPVAIPVAREREAFCLLPRRSRSRGADVGPFPAREVEQDRIPLQHHVLCQQIPPFAHGKDEAALRARHQTGNPIPSPGRGMVMRSNSSQAPSGIVQSSPSFDWCSR